MEWFVLWVIMAVIVGMIAASKGRNWFVWFLYGFAIWPIALVHTLLIEKETPPPEAERHLPRVPPATPYGEPSRIPYRPDPQAPAWPKDPAVAREAEPTAPRSIGVSAKLELPKAAPAPAPPDEKLMAEMAALRLTTAAIAALAVQNRPDPVEELARMTTLLRLVKDSAKLDGPKDIAAARATLADTVEGIIEIMASLVASMNPAISLKAAGPPEPPAPASPRDIYDLSKPVDIEMVYASGSDTVTHRRVTVESMSGPAEPGAIRLDGFTGLCHLRSETRTFRLDRVRSAVAADEGTPIQDLASWLLERKSRRRPRDLDQ